MENPKERRISKSTKFNSEGTSRRKFMGRLGRAAAASLAVSAAGLTTVTEAAAVQSRPTGAPDSNADSRALGMPQDIFL
jgi:hypothetical protein